MKGLAIVTIAVALGVIVTYLLQLRFGVIRRGGEGAPVMGKMRAKLHDKAERDSQTPVADFITNAVVNVAPLTRQTEQAQRDSLNRSGMKMSSAAFWAARFICIATCLIIASLGVTRLPEGDPRAIPALALGAVAGFALPQLYLLEVRRNWRENIERDLPAALDLMTITVSAGTTLESAMRIVAENTEGALSEGFKDVLAQAKFMELTTALRQFADNAKVQPLTLFAAAVAQARDRGIPIAEILEIQAETTRQYRRARLEEKVNKLPVKILFPIVFFIFPALFGVLLVPAGLQLLTSLGGM